jgi:purine-binding chemotaxis protein CheW
MILKKAKIPMQLVTFVTERYTFGLDVLDVQEVLNQQHMTPVPLAPPEILGLINLRGHIVTAIDMRERLKMPTSRGGAAQMNIILQLRDGCASLVVDSVGDVITVEQENYLPPPPSLDAPLNDMVCGVYKLDDRLLMHIDPDNACELLLGADHV